MDSKNDNNIGDMMKIDFQIHLMGERIRRRRKYIIIHGRFAMMARIQTGIYRISSYLYTSGFFSRMLRLI